MMENLREIKSLRGKREKHFLKENGEFIAYLYNEDVHYLKDGKYEEIDNTIEKRKDFFVNRSNRFRTSFGSDYLSDMMHLRLDNSKFFIDLKDKNDDVTVSNKDNKVCYENILDDVDIDYEVLANKIKESIILKEKSNLSVIEFVIMTDLKLELNKDGSISVFKGNEIPYTIDTPFMFDSDHAYCDAVYYTLETLEGGYVLRLHLNKQWLEDGNRVYPVVVDPTITVSNKANIYDTYIDSSNVSKNFNTDTLKVGVDKVNNKDVIYRSLLKFDLPSIGTGSSVVDAKLTLFSHHNDVFTSEHDSHHFIDVYALHQDWNETSATWNTMHDKYDSLIEDSLTFPRSEKTTDSKGNVTITSRPQNIDITNIVKRWYSTLPNYGILLKDHFEEYRSGKTAYSFYSKNHKVTNGNPTPYITITYVNQNGLEEYFTYEKNAYVDGSSYVNYYNGNLTTEFLLNHTPAGKFPVDLRLIYNTNDVVLGHDYGYGLGYKLNLYQTIKQVSIDKHSYLEYLDSDGTLHYFYEKDGTYVEEEGLGFSIVLEGDYYFITDKDGNVMKFKKDGDIWYLEKMIDTASFEITILYNENHLITKVIDADGEEIEILYLEDQIAFLSSVTSTSISYYENQVSSITSRNGATIFLHNDDHTLRKIIDVSQKSVEFLYYDVLPYRVKEVKEYGTSGALGETLQFHYHFDATSVVDRKGRYITYTFNQQGNTIGITNLNGDNDLRDGYCKSQFYNTYPEKANNKLESENVLIRPVHNYIENSSFETDYNGRYLEDIMPLRTIDTSSSGDYSLKLERIGNEDRILSYAALLPDGNDYTFSGYFKNDVPVKVSILVEMAEGNSLVEKVIPKNTEFTRYSLTSNYPTGSVSFEIFIEVLETGVCYLDDVQLEEGFVANAYSVVQNSDFSDGIAWWTYDVLYEADAANVEDNYEVVTLDGDDTALLLKLDPYKKMSLSQEFTISGVKGDTFNLSFWYKNLGSLLKEDDSKFEAYLKFRYQDNSIQDNTVMIPISYHNEEWQYFSQHFVAKDNFDSLELFIKVSRSVNQFYITKVSLFKDVENTVYTYDEEGNLVLVKSLSKGKEDFQYDKNHQLIGAFQPSGSNFVFEYDNVVKDRVINGISSTGISNKIIYDEKGNPVRTIIRNVGTTLDSDSTYYLRSKGTACYFDIEAVSKQVILKKDSCSYRKWYLEKVGNDYRIGFSLLPGYYITYISDQIALTTLEDEHTLFTLEKRKNGSYTIKPKLKNKYLCVIDGELSTKEIEVSEGSDAKEHLEESDASVQFYFEKVDDLFISQEAVYSNDGKTLIKTIDELGNEVNYDIDAVQGITRSITDAMGNTTEYTYNARNQVTSVTKDEKTVYYTYNEYQLLDKVILDNKEYRFVYDEFFNVKNIKIGDQTLITHVYEENNGNLLSSTYGNGDVVSYVYDDLDRLKKMVTETNEYHYYYNNFGDLALIKDLENTYEYIYDFATRLSSYRFNDFQIDYDYGTNDLVSKRNYRLGDTSKDVQYFYDENDSLVKVALDSDEIHYLYDDLGRLKEKNINNKINSHYTYLSHGKKTSFTIDKEVINGDSYQYTYDKAGNITDIYKNNELVKSYQYDHFYQLVKEDDYVLQKSYGYQYDKEGNMLERVEYSIGTDTVLHTDTYTYSDISWKDKLSKYNNEEIEYDAIGNMMKFGDSITLSWMDGRRLATYHDSIKDLNIAYTYNKDGIRTGKTVNGEKFEYYTENNKIIFEKRGNHMVYYLRDEEGNLEGFVYDNDIYYYTKTMNDDIVGISNSSGDVVATYEYDAWGNILDIKNNVGISIKSDLNHIGNINPFRYRSYYYDTETELYYLNARYYLPKIRRFINADSIIVAINNFTTYNLYCYAGNNPVNCADANGNLFEFIKKAAKKVWKSITSALGIQARTEKVESTPKFAIGKVYKYSNSTIMPGKVVGENKSYTIYSKISSTNIFKLPKHSLGQSIKYKYGSIECEISGTKMTSAVTFNDKVFMTTNDFGWKATSSIGFGIIDESGVMNINEYEVNRFFIAGLVLVGVYVIESVPAAVSNLSNIGKVIAGLLVRQPAFAGQ